MTHREFLQQLLPAENDLRALIGCFVRPVQDREDVFQDVVLTLWDKYTRREASEKFIPWARGVAMNKVRQYWDRTNRACLLFSPEAVSAILEAFERPTPPATVAIEALEKCLEPLPERSRRLLEMRYGESRSVPHIASQLNIGAPAIYKALARLRERIAGCVRNRLERMQRS